MHPPPPPSPTPPPPPPPHWHAFLYNTCVCVCVCTRVYTFAWYPPVPATFEVGERQSPRHKGEREWRACVSRPSEQEWRQECFLEKVNGIGHERERERERERETVPSEGREPTRRHPITFGSLSSSFVATTARFANKRPSLASDQLLTILTNETLEYRDAYFRIQSHVTYLHTLHICRQIRGTMPR